MTLLQLQYFICVVETGSFTQAARKAYTSQPTISRQIQMLEEELGYDLFNRSSKPLRLTEPGQILYEGMKAAIAQINTTLEKAGTVAEGKEGVLSLSFQAGYFAEYRFFPMLHKLREMCPTLQIRSNKMFSWDQIKGLRDGSIDIAIGLAFPHWDEMGFTVRNLGKIETLIVMSTNHRLAKKEILEYDDLCGETFFLTAPNGYQVDKVFKNRFCLDDVRQVEVPSSENAYFKVLSDNGLTISNPYDPVLLDSQRYHTLRFEAENEDSYVCVTNPDNTNPAVSLFLALLEKEEAEKETPRG
ncbi:MAG: LysR family transcriptional regulator [Eubacterium sp.]|nr:LysR family transcriptional regulator [Eubacterium sp.]